MPQYYFAGVSK